MAISTKETIINKVLESIDQLNKVTYKLKNSERVNGKILSGEQVVKCQRSPYKCYIEMLSPNKGALLSYKTGENNNKAIYKPNSFPYMAINLDPMGALIRKNNHHTIYELDFKPVATIIKSAVTNKSYTIKLKEAVSWDNTMCYHINFEALNKGFSNYKVLNSNETLRTIAKKLLLNEYRIIELNPTVNSFEDRLLVNQLIKVPISYVNTIDLYISKNNFLPVYQSFKDEKGVFEEYEYRNVVINPEFNKNEFDILK